MIEDSVGRGCDDLMRVLALFRCGEEVQADATAFDGLALIG